MGDIKGLELMHSGPVPAYQPCSLDSGYCPGCCAAEDPAPLLFPCLHDLPYVLLENYLLLKAARFSQFPLLPTKEPYLIKKTKLNDNLELMATSGHWAPAGLAALQLLCELWT